MNIDAFNGTNDSEFLVSFKFSGVSSVADPDDLQMGGEGGGGRCHNIFFSALGASVWSKNKGLGGGGGGGGAPLLDRPLKFNFSTSTSAIL